MKILGVFGGLISVGLLLTVLLKSLGSVSSVS